MKTVYTPENVTEFLSSVEGAGPGTLRQLAEGHISQAFSFEGNGNKRYVLRIADRVENFEADRYAGDVFGGNLLVPKVTEIGRFREAAYYCISAQAAGVPTNSLSLTEIQSIQPAMHEVFSRLFKTDISATSGYGEIDTNTGNAPSESWQTYLVSHVAKTSVDDYKKAAGFVGIDPEIIDSFMAQFNRNIAYASESRRLFHGDLGFDNLLVDNGNVTAVIDWAQVGYGDWMRDFARFDFWGPGRYGDAQEFAAKYDLEADHIDERIALYHAYNALLTIDFSHRHRNASTSEWLRQHIAEKLIG